MIIIGKLTEKKIVNPLTIFYSLWALIFYLTSLKLYKINEASEKTYNMMFIGLVAFAVGYYAWRIVCKRKRVILKIGRISIGVAADDTFTLRYKVLYFLGIITIIFYLRDFSITAGYLISGDSLNFIRQLAQDSTSALNDQSGILSVVRTLIITPYVMALQPIEALDFWFGKRDKKLLAINLIILLLRMITDGSRSNLIYFVLHFAIGYLFLYGKRRKGEKHVFRSIKEKKRSRKLIIVFGVLGVSFILWATISRSGPNMMKYAYYYFTMEPYMFESWAKTVDDANLVGYGLASTNGFSFAVLYILKNLTRLGSYPEFWHSINTMIGNTETDWLVISAFGSSANAYVSLFWYFYLDGRIIGIIIGMTLYGAISVSSFCTAIKNMSARTLCVYSFIIQGLLMSFVRFQFANIGYAIAFVMIMFLYKKDGRTTVKVIETT